MPQCAADKSKLESLGLAMLQRGMGRTKGELSATGSKAQAAKAAKSEAPLAKNSLQHWRDLIA